MRFRESIYIEVEGRGSAVYYNEADKRSNKIDYEENRKAGFELLKSDHINIWCTPSNEHCILYAINGFDYNNINKAATFHQEPKGLLYYEFSVNGMSWKKDSACKTCNIDWDWLEKQFSSVRCNWSKCQLLKLRDFFNGLFCGLDRLPYGEEFFLKKTEVIDRDIVLRRRCAYIDMALKRGKMPEKFSKLKGNYKWILEKGINIVEKQSEERKNGACIAYVDADDKRLIEKGISLLEKMLGEGLMDRVILYYMSEKGLDYYDELYNIQINDPDLVHFVDIIK